MVIDVSADSGRLISDNQILLVGGDERHLNKWGGDPCLPFKYKASQSSSRRQVYIQGGRIRQEVKGNILCF